MVYRRRKVSALIFEDNVVAAEGPAVVAGVEVVAYWEYAPCQRVVNTRGWRM